MTALSSGEDVAGALVEVALQGLESAPEPVGDWSRALMLAGAAFEPASIRRDLLLDAARHYLGRGRDEAAHLEALRAISECGLVDIVDEETVRFHPRVAKALREHGSEGATRAMLRAVAQHAYTHLWSLPGTTPLYRDIAHLLEAIGPIDLEEDHQFKKLAFEIVSGTLCFLFNDVGEYEESLEIVRFIELERASFVTVRLLIEAGRSSTEMALYDRAKIYFDRAQKASEKPMYFGGYVLTSEPEQ